MKYKIGDILVNASGEITLISYNQDLDEYKLYNQKFDEVIFYNEKDLEAHGYRLKKAKIKYEINDVLQLTKIENVLDQREKTHGEFEEVAKVSQSLKEILKESENFNHLPSVAREALEMICVKIARLVTCDTVHRDNVVDIIGYATLMLKDIDKNNLKGE